MPASVHAAPRKFGKHPQPAKQPVADGVTHPQKLSTTKAQPTHKSRIVKRRGRAVDSLGSDDEIVRAPRSDTDSDDSTLDSASDSGSESVHAPARHQAMNGKSKPVSRPVTAATSLEPETPPTDVAGPLPKLNDTTAPLMWADMVAEENDSSLPVVDFADLGAHAMASSSSAQPRENGRSRSPSNAKADEAPIDHPPTKRTFGRTARQAYQQRLDTDPSYVPRVGEFWGHDERLMDKELRSLSGWWRGKWRGRGGARGGFGAPWTPRGRGGFAGRGGSHMVAASSTAAGTATESPSQAEDAAPSQEQEPAPIERPWTHDGFEEMRKRDQATATNNFRGGRGGALGRGGFWANSRGGSGRGFGTGWAANRGRGGHQGTVHVGDRTMSPTTSADVPHHKPFPGRAWYPTKPERSWTKHADGFLYNDASLRPRHPNQGQGVRVHLPGDKKTLIVRLPLAKSSPGPSKSTPAAPVRPITVRLPSSSKAATVTTPAPEPEAITTVAEHPLDEPFPPVRLPGQPSATQPAPNPPTFAPVNTAVPPSPADAPPLAYLQHQYDELRNASRRAAEEESRVSEELRKLQMAEERNAATAATEPSAPDSTTASSSKAEATPATTNTFPTITTMPHPGMPPPQSVPSPVAYPPYGYHMPTALPPGIGVMENGMYYEIATGRPVYFTAPPPPMYAHTPPPSLVHPHVGHHRPGSVAFIPPHVLQPVPSPDYLAHRASPIEYDPAAGWAVPQPMPAPAIMVDPATGTPLFSLPRQRGRIEIRAPGDKRPHEERARSDATQSSPSTQPATRASPTTERPRYPPTSAHARRPSSLRTSISGTAVATADSAASATSAAPPPAPAPQYNYYTGYYESPAGASPAQAQPSYQLGEGGSPQEHPHGGMQYYYPHHPPVEVNGGPYMYEYPPYPEQQEREPPVYYPTAA